MRPTFDRALQARVEDAGINASAPREQLWIDGWLVRRCPGKAKRARCIQAVAAGRSAIDARLARCLSLYADAGLRPYVRITPFSEPAGLDDHLASIGMERLDDTRVMMAALPVAAGIGRDAAAPPGIDFEPVDAATYASWVGVERGSTIAEQIAHAERLRDSPVLYQAVVARDREGRTVAGGQVAIEQDLAGLYDVFTPPASRRQGFSQALCRHLLSLAQGAGARWAYLQVDSSNAAARSVYAGLGFADAYAYHYRTPSDPEAGHPSTA